MASIVFYAKNPGGTVRFFVNALGGQDAGFGIPLRSERHVVVHGVRLAFQPKDYQKYGWPGGLRGTNSDPKSKPMAVSIRLRVDDVMAAYNACLAHGAKPTSDKPSIYLMVMTATVRTPDGHLLELQGPLPADHPTLIKARQEADERAKLIRALGYDLREAQYHFDDNAVDD